MYIICGIVILAGFALTVCGLALMRGAAQADEEMERIMREKNNGGRK